MCIHGGTVHNSKRWSVGDKVTGTSTELDITQLLRKMTRLSVFSYERSPGQAVK